MALITKAEIISNAYTRNVNTAYINDNDIIIGEYQFIRPILTENLYDYVSANQGSYTTLIDTYIKPALAQYMKYLLFDELQVEISDRGMNKLLSDNAEPINGQTRADLKAIIMQKANALGERLKDYIHKRVDANDTLYDLYNDFTGVVEEDQLLGGMYIKGQDVNANNDLKV